MKRFIGFRKPAACALLAGFALMLLAGAACTRNKELPVVRLAYTRSIDDLPFFVGMEEKLFEREGVRVEMTRLTGNTSALAGVMRNDIQAAVIGLPQVYSAAGQSIPIKVWLRGWAGLIRAPTADFTCAKTPLFMISRTCAANALPSAATSAAAWWCTRRWSKGGWRPRTPRSSWAWK